MTSEKVKLFCILDGDITAFPCNISSDESVGDLKDAIKKKQSPLLDDIRANDLILWRVFIASSPKRQILLSSLIEEKDNTPKELEDPTNEISEVFGAAPAKKTIHVIVQRPVAHCIVQRPVAAPDMHQSARQTFKFLKVNNYSCLRRQVVQFHHLVSIARELINGVRLFLHRND
ncbi:hypothetical protein BGX20_002015 [Mortierella sp. AD010]|nr:hypothetical protein BGX20_002015 [Mortierella sp. AD010]